MPVLVPCKEGGKRFVLMYDDVEVSMLLLVPCKKKYWCRYVVDCLLVPCKESFQCPARVDFVCGVVVVAGESGVEWSGVECVLPVPSCIEGSVVLQLNLVPVASCVQGECGTCMCRGRAK